VSASDAIAQATLGTKWERGIWLVGGVVRDEMLDLPLSEIDLVLETDALALAIFLREKNLSSIEPITYARFGTALLRVEGTNVELVTARKESYERQSRKPSVEPATIGEDAMRRDFTINALFKNLHTGEVRDPTGKGLADLRSRVLRTPLDPDDTFDDDPLRMLRAVRFKNRFDLIPAPGLLESIQRNAQRLEIVSGERIRDEFTKMLLHESVASSLRDLMDTGLLAAFAPECKDGVGVEQGSYHAKDVWEHTLDVVEQASDTKDIHVLLAAWLHDVGKPQTRSIEPGGRTRFFGHEKVGGEIARTILRRMRYSGSTVNAVSKLVANHMRLGSAVPFTKAAARRLIRDMDDLLEPLLQLCEADAGSLRAIPQGVDFAEVRRQLESVKQEAPVGQLDSPLSGEEIMEILGLEAGPKVGRIKGRLREAVLEGEIAAGDKEGAARIVKKLSEQ
jgi:poly(A) polymerase